MTPIRRSYTTAQLRSISFMQSDSQSEAELPWIFMDDGAFMSWWRPHWWERLAIAFGRPVRVAVSYGAGPLQVDTRGL